MTSVSAVLLAAAAVAAVANWVSRALDDHRLEYATKPTATVLLLAVTVTIETAQPQQGWFAAAVGLSLAGDVFLMLPGGRFLAGLAAFLLAHVAFIVGFAVAGIGIAPFLIGTLVVAAVTLPVGVRIVGSLRASDQARLVGPVIAYMVVIGLMVAAAVGVGSPVAVAGAGTFLVSDSLLAWNRFVRPVPWAPVGVMVTYHLGLAGLVLSLVR